MAISKFTMIAGLIALILLLGAFIYSEFYVWRAHDYKADYAARQKCIEDSEHAENCDSFDVQGKKPEK